jgi:hypothetical protein
VIVHYGAVAYPKEIGLARRIASGKALVGVTWDTVVSLNAAHARDHATPGKLETLDLLRRNSEEAALAVRAFADDDLDTAASVSLNADAPLTAQFLIEDHALRHSFHHLARLKAAFPR